MADIVAGDLVIAVPIGSCSIGHPGWQREFDHPEMNEKAYLVTWTGFSAYWKRPIIAVAGRPGHFCAGCFARRKQPEPLAAERAARRLEPVA